MRFHAIGHPPSLDENPIKLSFTYLKSKEQISVLAREGESLLDVAHNNGIDLEGACESSLACSTCHVILEPTIYDSLGEPCEEEEDLLDLAYGLTHTSRLGC
jgi:ferredoxin